MPATLDDILSQKRLEVEALKVRLRRMGSTTVMRAMTHVRSLTELLSKVTPGADQPIIIPELKKGDPWRGVFCERFDILEVAQALEEAGAPAFAVQTDNAFFKGSLDDLHYLSRRTKLPVIMRDFVIDEAQLTEAKAKGADCAVLMASVLDAEVLQRFIHFGQYIMLETLVEVSNEDDLEKALAVGARVIGIHNRTIGHTEIDLDRAERLVKSLPAGTLAVAVGGVRAPGDVQRFQAMGFHGVIVGELLMRSDDMAKTYSELLAGGSASPA